MNNILSYTYIISGQFNGFVNIGNTTRDPETRFKEHVSQLETNTHFNQNLQFSFNNHGRDNLQLVILESVDASKRGDNEKKWIVTLGNQPEIVLCNKNMGGGNTKSGYQLSRKNKRNQSRAKTNRPIEQTRAQEYSFIDPKGTVANCIGLKGLCEKYNLNQGHLSRVARGSLKHHKGWKKNPTHSETIPK